MRYLPALALWCALARAGTGLDGLRVTYLGNEGFFVRSGSQAVLFDALFGQGLPDYDRVPANIEKDIETGRAPFGDIRLVLISHAHPDHFDAASTMAFLRSHPSTIVIAPNEVCEQLGRATQIHCLAPQPGQMITRDIEGIRLGLSPCLTATLKIWLTSSG